MTSYRAVLRGLKSDPSIPPKTVQTFHPSQSRAKAWALKILDDVRFVPVEEKGKAHVVIYFTEERMVEDVKL